MTPIERAYEELDALTDFTDDDMSAVEREYARITGGTVDETRRKKPGVQKAIEKAQQRIKELEQ